MSAIGSPSISGKTQARQEPVIKKQRKIATNYKENNPTKSMETSQEVST